MAAINFLSVFPLIFLRYIRVQVNYDVILKSVGIKQLGPQILLYLMKLLYSLHTWSLDMFCIVCDLTICIHAHMYVCVYLCNPKMSKPVTAGTSKC